MELGVALVVTATKVADGVAEEESVVCALGISTGTRAGGIVGAAQAIREGGGSRSALALHKANETKEGGKGMAKARRERGISGGGKADKAVTSSGREVKVAVHGMCKMVGAKVEGGKGRAEGENEGGEGSGEVREGRTRWVKAKGGLWNEETKAAARGRVEAMAAQREHGGTYRVINGTEKKGCEKPGGIDRGGPRRWEA